MRPDSGATAARCASRVLSASALLAVGLTGPAPAQPMRLGEVHRMLPGTSERNSAIALGDVDGDGDLDALFGNGGDFTAAQNRLYRNDGSGVFTDATPPLPSLLDYTTAVALGDVDGDGDLDALIGVGGFAARQNRLYVNNGTGALADATPQIPTISDYTWSVALADVDADGDLDAWIANSGQDRLDLNNGSGFFTTATALLPASLDVTQDVVLSDVDGDGDLDAATANYFDPTRLYLNNGTGSFAIALPPLPVSPNSVREVALGDVDGDADLDLLTGNYAQDRLYLNGGTGLFSEATSQLPVVFGSTSDVSLADVEGDGDLDALLAPPHRLYLNNGSGVYSDGTSQLLAPSNWATAAVAAGDLDGDGDLDALLGSGQAPATPSRLCMNDGAGVFADVTVPFPAVPDPTTAVALGDVDGDGDLDALSANAALGGLTRLFLGDGSGGFADATSQVPQIPLNSFDVALGDVDGDGDLDAFLATGLYGSGQQDALYLNNGSGGFVNGTGQLPVLADDTRAVALGDVDADGDLDALLGEVGVSGSGAQNRLQLNDGTGVFVDGTGQLPAILDDTLDVALGDVDGDGDLDALVGNGLLSGQPNGLLLNNGSGTFTNAAAQLPALSDRTLAVALGDVDGDGDLDAVIGNANFCSPLPCPAGQQRLHLNNGSGTFLDATSQLPAVPGSTEGVVLGDLDGDGDLDVLTGGTPGHFFLNNGSGVFADATTQIPSLPGGGFALGDLDGDGDTDAWWGGWGQDRVLANLTYQLAWRGIPRIGKPLTLDLNGPPGGTWTLGFALGSASLPLPPFGTLRLDPASLDQVGAGALEPQGRASVTYSVPANPSLVGLPVYWQALVGAPARLTNLETTVATNL